MPIPALFRSCPSLLMLGVAGFLLGVSPAQGQILITQYGVAVTENFNGMGTAGNGAPLPAFWRAQRLQGVSPYPVRQLGTYAEAGTTATRREGNNAGNTAGIINYGAGPDDEATDRALGFMSNSNETTGAQSGNIYAQFRNDTGTSLGAVALAYDIEKYRMGTNPAGYRFELSYSMDGENWTVAGDAFSTYFAPDASNGGYESAPGVVRAVSGTLALDTPIADGGLFYLAWNYSVASGNGVTSAQGLALDNFSLTAVPEPSTMAILALGAMVWLGARRLKGHSW